MSDLNKFQRRIRLQSPSAVSNHHAPVQNGVRNGGHKVVGQPPAVIQNYSPTQWLYLAGRSRSQHGFNVNEYHATQYMGESADCCSWLPKVRGSPAYSFAQSE